MPRTFSTAIQAEIDKQYAGEPMIMVEVNWVDDAWVAYTDRKLNGEEYPYPLLVSIGQFDTTEVISGGSDSQQTTITLNDIDGTLRNIIDSHDIHLRPVRVYLTFQGLPVEEKALMFEGVINSPIDWDEGGRTLTFAALSKLESVEAGFTMEDGDFPYIEPQDRNKPWPLVFGQICNMQSVKVRGTRKGFLAEGVGVADPTIEERLCQANKLQCPVHTATTTEDGDVGDEQTEDGVDTGVGDDSNIQLSNVSEGEVDLACLERKFNEICEILTEQVQQAQYVKTEFTVRGGDKFPQNETITIQIREVKFTGTMNGELFTVSSVTHPDPKDNPPCMEINDSSWGYRYGPGEDTFDDLTVEGCEGDGSDLNKEIVGGSHESWEYFNLFERSNFIWLPPGAEVILADEAEELNIVSLLPGTVDRVSAYRNYSDTSLLTQLPTDLYTVVTADFGGYDVIEIRLNQPLSTLDKDEYGDLDDEIYVSFTSTVGPNPADIIQWLVETYTDLSVDATSFAAVNSSLTNYPSNFFVKARPRVLDLIRDVAYQARCAVYIRDNTVYLVYLSEEPTSIKTLTESDILPNTFRITHTETEDLETRSTISWSDGEAGVFKKDPTEFEFVLKHNIPKYGVFDARYDYYTMNIFELVEKSATFWSIRKSNTWKMVQFETPIVHLNLDVFDCVTINLSQFGPIKVVIEESRFNLDRNTISFKAWTPIRSGESSEYLWAWPSQQDQNAIHPLSDDVAVEAGDSFPLQVTPPEGHPLRGAYDPDSATLNTDGDKNPSDLDDTLPTLECKISTGAEIAGDVEPEFDPFEPLAEENFQDRLEDIETGGVDGTSLDDGEDKEACGQPIQSGGGCTYEVNVIYITPAAVTTFNTGGLCAGPCGCSVTGRSCFGSQHTFCHTFGSAFAATAFASQKKQEAHTLWELCQHQCGVTAPLQVQGPTGIEGDGPFGDCDPIADADPADPGAQEGQVAKPKLKTGDSETAPDVGDL